jgi:hypothetical protein
MQRNTAPRGKAAASTTVVDAVRRNYQPRAVVGTGFYGNLRPGLPRTKDTGLALYGPGLTWGDDRRRRGFERLYDLRKRIAPPAFQRLPGKRRLFRP